MNYRLGILVSCCAALFASPALATANEYNCQLKLKPVASNDCSAPVTVSEFIPGDEAVLHVNMNGAGGPYSCMTVELVLASPNGWVANIGNSPTNNGLGGFDSAGDGGVGPRDSELEVRAGATSNLRVYGNQNSPPGTLNAHNMLTVDDFASGLSRLTFEVDDGSLRARDSLSGKNACLRSPFIYRRPDQFYHIGLNRVIDLTGVPGRVGNGVWSADITLSSTPCVCQ
jgi:hypothetical protein